MKKTSNTEYRTPNAEWAIVSWVGIEKSRMLPGKSLTPILAETEELIRIFFSSIRTAEQNAK
jgi:hypothetical protein